MSNPRDIIGIVKEIPLTKGMVAIVDAEDYEWLSKHKWYAKERMRKNAPICFYACRSEWKNGKSQTIRMHRQILDAKYGEDVDHRNGNGLDNRKENIRLCSRTENAQGIHVAVGKSRFKGVHFKREHPFSQWGATIRIHGKQKTLGYWPTQEEAAIAYDLAAFEEFGEFAVPNLLPKVIYDRMATAGRKLLIAHEALERMECECGQCNGHLASKALSRISSLSVE